MKTSSSKEIAKIWTKGIKLKMEKESYDNYSIANKTTLKEILTIYLKEKTLLKINIDKKIIKLKS